MTLSQSLSDSATVTTLEHAPTILHDGTFRSCNAVKEWAKLNGFRHISTFNANGGDDSNVIQIGRELNVIHLRAGDRAFVLKGKLVKDWWAEDNR